MTTEKIIKGIAAYERGQRVLQFWIKMWVAGVILGFTFGYLWAEWDACTDGGGKYIRGAFWMECVQP